MQDRKVITSTESNVQARTGSLSSISITFQKLQKMVLSNDNKVFDCRCLVGEHTFVFEDDLNM